MARKDVQEVRKLVEKNGYKELLPTALARVRMGGRELLGPKTEEQ